MAEQLTALSIMQNAPVIPVIVLHDVDHAVSMAKALVGGGIRVLEVTLRTPQGLPSIEAIAKAVPEAIVGAGTVRSSAAAKAAAAAGARFAVSPGYSRMEAAPARPCTCPCCPVWPRPAKSWRRWPTGSRSSSCFRPRPWAASRCPRPGPVRLARCAFAPRAVSPPAPHPLPGTAHRALPLGRCGRRHRGHSLAAA